MRMVLLLMLAAISLSAEFLHVRMDIRDMDCLTCVQSLEMGLKKIRGVEKVTVGPQNSAEFILQPGNKVTLERLRDAIKGVGFTPASAHVLVKGKPVTASGQWRFEVDGIAKTYNLAVPSNDTIRQIRKRDRQYNRERYFRTSAGSAHHAVSRSRLGGRSAVTDRSLAFRALQHPNFRIFIGGLAVSLIGTWIQSVALSWLLYRLTHSEFLQGVANFCSHMPVLLLSPLAGLAADRFPRHRIILITQTIFLCHAVLLAWLTLTNRVTVPQVLTLAVLLGCRMLSIFRRGSR